MTGWISQAGHVLHTVAQKGEEQFPFLKNRRELANQRILSQLKKIGVASRSEVKALRTRIEHLEREIELLKKHQASS